MLDPTSRLVVREVCKDFKESVDHGTGLWVRINDYDPGNLAFVKSVEVSDGCILHISDQVFKNAPKNSKTSPVFR